MKDKATGVWGKYSKFVTENVVPIITVLSIVVIVLFFSTIGIGVAAKKDSFSPASTMRFQQSDQVGIGQERLTQPTASECAAVAGTTDSAWNWLSSTAAADGSMDFNATEGMMSNRAKTDNDFSKVLAGR